MNNSFYKSLCFLAPVLIGAAGCFYIADIHDLSFYRLFVLFLAGYVTI